MEGALPLASCAELAAVASGLRAALRGNADLQEFFHGELPDQTWLLTFRDAVGQRLAAADGLSEARPEPEDLAAILAAVGGLPVQVVQPLPIGFGTPRWDRPLAAADPAAWEAWLGDVAAAFAAGVELRMQQQQQQQQLDGLLEELSSVVINLACAMRWASVNVDDDRLQTPQFAEHVLGSLRRQVLEEEELGQRAAPSRQQQQQQQQHREQQEQGRDRAAAHSSGAGAGASAAPAARLLLAGRLQHRIAYTMLQLLLPPPRPLLEAFFEATEAPLQASAFTLEQLQGIVRGLLYLGAAPPEPWLRALAEIARTRAAELPPDALQCFVEGFRLFSTKLAPRKSSWLRDATSQLEEFTLC